MLKRFGANLIPVTCNLFTAFIIFFSLVCDQFIGGFRCFLARPLDSTLFISIQSMNISLYHLNSIHSKNKVHLEKLS